MERPRAWFELDDPSLRPSKQNANITEAETETQPLAEKPKSWGQIVEENGQQAPRQWTEADLGI
ncbi:hypothetical protein KAZ66_03635 [Candidatus Woesebacteria bacterium]|nr:hypothetical protein [Candidatus Woesebacteria bacterium]